MNNAEQSIRTAMNEPIFHMNTNIIYDALSPMINEMWEVKDLGCMWNMLSPIMNTQTIGSTRAEVYEDILQRVIIKPYVQ